MTIDEAIMKLEAEAQNYKYDREDAADINDVGTAAYSQQCADDREQLAEWLSELKDLKAFITSIYQILGEHFEYPCSNEVAAELMKERSTCFDCGGEINNEECWRRFFTTMIGEKCNDD